MSSLGMSDTTGSNDPHYHTKFVLQALLDASPKIQEATNRCREEGWYLEHDILDPDILYEVCEDLEEGQEVVKGSGVWLIKKDLDLCQDAYEHQPWFEGQVVFRYGEQLLSATIDYTSYNDESVIAQALTKLKPCKAVKKTITLYEPVEE